MVEWFKEIGSNFSKIAVSARDNLGSVLLMVGIIILLFVASTIAENYLCRKNGVDHKSEKFKIHRMTLIAIMAVLAGIFDQFGLYMIPPNMYKLNVSELPCVICSFAMGPVAGLLTETVKIILNLILNGTSTAFVGEFANFAMGCCYILPASIIYFRKKTRKNALIALAVGTLACTLIGLPLNAFILIPMYARLYCGGDLDKLISILQSGREIASSVKNLLIFIVIPCNFIKCAVCSIITMVIYKPVSHLIKQNDYSKK